MRCPPLAAAALGLAAAAAAPAVPAASAGPAPIIGGSTTTVGQFPTVVGVTVGNGLCTGTLITPEWVLTAAHCITPELVGLSSQQAVTASTRVHFGTVNLQQSLGTVRMAAMTIPKPEFRANRLGSHDLGLIKLAQPYTDAVPTPVNLDPLRAPVGTRVTMVGFGATQQGGGGTLGVQFVLEDRTSISCSQFGVSDANLLCFSQLDDKGKCQGDSGGPSLAQIDGRAVVVGVTSFGDQSCSTFGADTRTDVERDFLLQYIPQLQGCETDADCPNEICFDQRCIAQPFAPTGIGTACTANSECDSGTCAEGPGGKRCTEVCVAGAEGACPDGFDCLASTGASGACWPADDGGCCDTSGRGAPTMLLGAALVALALGRRRRGAARG